VAPETPGKLAEEVRGVAIPEVSVVLPSYNHAGFVRQAIDSVLAQTGVTLELLVADDGSSDGSRDVIAAVDDPRLRFFPHESNRGACLVLNELIAFGESEFVAFMCSDDYWIDQEKLARQVRLMRERPSVGASFEKALFVDGGGEIIPKEAVPLGRLFDQGNRSRGAWLRTFYDEANCLCAPSVVLRRSCLAEAGFYDNRYRQIPDLDLWVRLAKRFDLHIGDAESTGFRVRRGQSVSQGAEDASIRSRNELLFIFRSFFDDVPLDVFVDGFGDLVTRPGFGEGVEYDIEKALVLLKGSEGLSEIRGIAGLERLYGLFASEPHRAALAGRYGLDEVGFHELTGTAAASGVALAELQREFDERTAWAVSLDRHVGELSARISQLEDELQRARATTAEAEARLVAVEGSSSWRLTAPLRRLKRGV
jgi:glycosyltransferase involved in cell wall biosynthesis